MIIRIICCFVIYLITMSCYKTLFMLLSFALVSHAAYSYFIKKKQQKCKEVHEVLLFSCEAGSEMKKSKYSRSMITKSMDRLLYYLSRPKYNLDVCMYLLTSADLTNVLLKLHYKGVKIRIITDMASLSGSSIKKLSKHEIPMRWIKSTNLMHHKFCLADTLCDDEDATPYLITGSLNWTNQAVCGNYDDCLVTTQKELIKQYQVEFERLWILFKPNVD